MTSRSILVATVFLSLFVFAQQASAQIDVFVDPVNDLSGIDCTGKTFTFTFSEPLSNDAYFQAGNGSNAATYGIKLQLPPQFEFFVPSGGMSHSTNGGNVTITSLSSTAGALVINITCADNNKARHDILTISNIGIRGASPCNPNVAKDGDLVFAIVPGSLQLVSMLFSPGSLTLSNQLTLPVELTTFTALLRNEVVALKWSTATETNNYGFDVERSFDRENWEKIGFVAGSGTTSSQRDYAFDARLTQLDMQQRLVSFRLRQIDRDGSIDYSPVVSVSPALVAGTVELQQNFPNPFNPATNISFNLPASDVVSLSVYNELGVEVARIHDGTLLERGWHTESFNATELPSGLYMYRLQTSAGTSSRTMMLMK